ncbi:hypothetical protein ACEQ8A_002761 [Vibrio fluvialis]
MKKFDSILPQLEEFEMDEVIFKVVDPSVLPPKTLKEFDKFMAGATVPHRVYVYSHDYSRFCGLVRNGTIKID